MSPGIPVHGVSELVLEVVDLDAAEKFYAGVLGLPVVDRWEDSGRIWLMAGTQTRIGLWRPQLGIANGRGGLHVHYALHIDESDFDGALATLRDHGYDPEIVSFEDNGRGRSFYVSDPDGNVVECWTWDVKGHLTP
ncbi:MAG: VOC family protein [Actinobacteria bacterium]|nr:VOC family protein [Actinomycetota bacterium]